MKNYIWEMKNSIDGFNSRLDTTEEKSVTLKWIAVKTIQNESEEGKSLKYMKSTSVPCVTIPHSLI